MGTLEEIKKNKVIAVIRAETPDIALEFARGCIDGGIKIIEITFSFSRVERIISELSKIEDIEVGAGTLLDSKMAHRALEAGASFLVSPHVDEEIVELAKSENVPTIQGALTSTEIVNAWKLGVDMAKIFPVTSVGGASYVKAIKDPLPFADIMVTGGVGYDNFIDYLDAGASAVGLVSAFLNEDKRIKYDTVVENSKKIVERAAAFNRELT